MNIYLRNKEAYAVYYIENIHGRAEIWNLSSSVHIDIERVSAANE